MVENTGAGKKREVNKKEGRLVKGLTLVYLVPLFGLIGFNVLNSLLRTGYFELYQYVEIVLYDWCNPFLLAAGAVGILLLVWFLSGKKALKTEYVKYGAIIWGTALSLAAVFLFRAMAKCDSEALSLAATEFSQNNYEAFEQGEYFYMYPFQLGYTAFMELIYRLFGVDKYVIFQLVNVVCIADIVYILGKLTWELFEDEYIYRLGLFFSMGLLPLFLLATFIYGDIPGWCMGMNAILLVLRYLKAGRWSDILKASAFLSVGVVMKSNMNILVVAAVIALLLKALEKRKARLVLWAAGLLVVSQLGMLLVNGIYAYRLKTEVPEGIPKLAWVAMGLQEPYEDGSASGWYNGYNWNVYAENGFDREKTEEACMDDLEQSLTKMLHSPRYAVSFFYDKFTSQWNEPTFMSLITNEWYSRNGKPQSALAISLLYGRGRDILYALMKVGHFLMFLCAAAGCLTLLKSWKLERAYFALNIFGGILFHMLWEAKSRYVLGYFLLLLPLAACGCGRIFRGRKRSTSEPMEMPMKPHHLIIKDSEDVGKNRAKC